MPDTRTRQPRPFWSGTITFGLINLPVSLYVANKSSHVPLRMVDESGTPLTRRYVCPRHEQTLTADEIVRGYAVDDDRFVVVEDDELDALAPAKSRDIDLRRFVAVTEIDPMYFNRTYVLAPDKDATKAYRLLAQSMEDEQRAGIATFVMRGKAHVVAIIAEKGLLHAETLRFHDELRSPQDVGLPPIQHFDQARVRRMRKSMRSRERQPLNRKHLADRHSQAVRKRIDQKLKKGADVVTPPETAEVEDDAQDNDNVIDLMQVLKDSLREKKDTATRSKKRRNRKSGGSKSDAGGEDDRAALDALTKTQLYERAQERNVTGRSRMTKAELVDAIKRRDT